jgi:hypothetical protein
MRGDEAIAFVTGLVIGALLTAAGIGLFWAVGNNRHDLAWNDVACISYQHGKGTPTDPIYFEPVCVSTPEIASYLQHKSER